jgi:hypothetical protein
MGIMMEDQTERERERESLRERERERVREREREREVIITFVPQGNAWQFVYSRLLHHP